MATDAQIKDIQQKAIAEFVNKQAEEYKKHSANAIDEDIALAMGWFGVPLRAFYDLDVETEADLESELLGNIVKYRFKRAQYDKEKEV